MSRKLAGLAVFSVVVVLAGCASNSSFRTAKPLGKGETEAFVAFSGIKFSESLFDLGGYFLEMGAGVGITDALDIGVRWTFPSSGALEAKYTLVGTNQEAGFFLAPGFRAGYTELPTFNDETSANRIEFAVPIYLTYSPISFLQLTAVPAYTGRITIRETEEDSDLSPFRSLVGANLNLKLGAKTGVVIEGSYYRDLKTEVSELQYGLALLFPINNLLPSFLQ